MMRYILLCTLSFTVSAAILASPLEKKIPKDVEQAQQTVFNWINTLEGKTVKQVEEVLGKPTSVTEWELRGRKEPIFKYELSRQIEITIYTSENLATKVSLLLLSKKPDTENATKMIAAPQTPEVNRSARRKEIEKAIISLEAELLAAIEENKGIRAANQKKIKEYDENIAQLIKQRDEHLANKERGKALAATLAILSENNNKPELQPESYRESNIRQSLVKLRQELVDLKD